MRTSKEFREEYLSQYCMICLKTSPSNSNIINGNKEGVQVGTQIILYREMYEQTCGVVILENDPIGICFDCLNNLLTSFKFHLKCKLTRSQWRDHGRESQKVKIEVKEEPVDEVFIQQGPIISSSDDKIEPNKFYTCRVCENYSGSSMSMLMKHYKLEHPHVTEIQCPFCDLKFDRTWRAERHGAKCEKKPTQKKMYSCHICRLLVPSLDSHIDAVHHYLKLYQCDHCKRRFGLKRTLAGHILRNHASRLFTCRKCNAAFLKHSKLVAHIRVEHGPSYTCHHCGYKFKIKTHLRVHLMRHKGIKDVICEICSKSFLTYEDLRKHKRQNHDRQIKEWSCRICFKIFQSKSILVQHSGTHRKPEYPCPVCRITYRWMKNLRSHVEIQHPNYELPPKGTVINRRFKLERMKKGWKVPQIYRKNLKDIEV